MCNFAHSTLENTSGASSEHVWCAGCSIWKRGVVLKVCTYSSKRAFVVTSVSRITVRGSGLVSV